MIHQLKHCDKQISLCYFLPYGAELREILCFLLRDLLFFQKLIYS